MERDISTKDSTDFTTTLKSAPFHGFFTHFFKKGVEAGITVNRDRYRTLINDFIFINMDDINQGKMWFQGDGHTCHTKIANNDLLKLKFENKLIWKKDPSIGHQKRKI